MGLNDTPSGERLRISFFGKRNAGKSSLVNAVTGQQLAVVSDTLGTTTDPVSKAMELLPLGPVVITDTPGYDDEGELGEKRVRKTKQILNKSDIAVLVTDASRPLEPIEEEMLQLFVMKNIPYIIARNKVDTLSDSEKLLASEDEHIIYTSATEGLNIDRLKDKIGGLNADQGPGVRLVGDIISPGQLIVLVIPIDEAAPKGRLILPQQQAIRDILESGAYAITTRETELSDLLERLGEDRRPDLVITDSQAFERVSREVPEDIPLTSFSILMARYKGFLETAVKGARAIDELRDGDKVLISEGCTHHRQCGDIGTVKLPNWLRQRTGRELIIETSSGGDFPEDLEEYSLIIHCGGCMLSAREMTYRMKCAIDAGVPFTNYGVAIAYMKGILDRSIAMIPHSSAVTRLIDKLERDHTLTRDEWRCILENFDQEDLEYAGSRARMVADRVYGRDIYIRGIVEFSNICNRNCNYCGLRSGNSRLERYRLSEDDILECCRDGYRYGFRTFVLQSGEDPYYDRDMICRIVRRIREEYPDVAITLSIGEKSYEDYKAFREAGADRYLLRHETANREHYNQLHPSDMSWENRMRCLRDLKSLGYQVGCGVMIGAPGQTTDCLIDDMEFMGDFRPEMIGLGPFLPHSDTPYRDEPKGSYDMTLLLISLCRLMLPDVLLPATTALGTIRPNGREMGVLAGANVIMPNLSPVQVRDKYMLYDNKICTGDTSDQCRGCIERRMELIGYNVVVSRGDHIASTASEGIK